MHQNKLSEFNELTASRALKRPATDLNHTYNIQPRQDTLSWPKGSAKRPSLSTEELGRLDFNMVTNSLLPVSFVEQPSFKELINACQPGATLPTRYSITKSLEKKQETSMAAVEDAMTKVEWIATTTDCWSAHRRSYLGVTAHWLCRDSFKRESAALACRRLTGSHTYELLAEQLKIVHCDFGINSKIVKTTTDNGSNYIKAFAVFALSEDELDVIGSSIDIDSILSNEDDSLELPTHQRCAPHSLNLISTTDAAGAETQSVQKAQSGYFRQMPSTVEDRKSSQSERDYRRGESVANQTTLLNSMEFCFQRCSMTKQDHPGDWTRISETEQHMSTTGLATVGSFFKFYLL